MKAIGTENNEQALDSRQRNEPPYTPDPSTEALVYVRVLSRQSVKFI